MALTFLLAVAALLLGSQAGGQCINRAVRLVGGSSDNEGRVEVCVRGEWGAVCNDLWDRNDASVVCRQVGYCAEGAVTYSTTHFGSGNGSIFMDDVVCRGDEDNLFDCQFDSEHDCSRSEHAAVGCNSCCEGEVRLEDGSVFNEGRVEVCVDGIWGTVCNDYFASIDASVVCRQLGFSRFGATVLLETDAGIGTILMDNVHCSGSELRLIDCEHHDAPNCYHYEDVGVNCIIPVQCEEGDIRVAGGTANSGRVEVCIHEEWNSLCALEWTALNTKVVCRQLGYASSGLGNITTLPGTGNPIHQGGYACTGIEDRIVDCNPGTLPSLCSHSDDLTIECNDTGVCENGSLRLVNSSGDTGEDMMSGRIEICWNGVWGTVCNHNWSLLDAAVVCYELGFSRRSLSSGYFGQGSGPILLRNVACTGREDALIDCPHDPIGDIGQCTHENDVGVLCRNLLCTDGDVRLVDGLSEYEGRLEICSNELWGTVCNDSWQQSATYVVCRQLGFNITGNEVNLETSLFTVSSSSTPILLDNIHCIGTENTLLHCTHAPIGNHTCLHDQDIKLRCGQCSEYDVRLVDGANENEGRVEVCVNGRWGTVCDDGWDSNDAVIVCRQLNLPAAGDFVQTSVAVEGRVFPPNPSLPIVMSAVSCIGTESTLGDCTYHGSNDLLACAHSKDAGVNCSFGLPNAPVDVLIIDVTQTTLQLSWFKPNHLHYSYPITGYTVLCTSEQGQQHSVPIKSNETFLVTVTNLQPFTEYTCCVNADSTMGAGPMNCTTGQTLDGKLPAPILRQVERISASQIAISWEPRSHLNMNDSITNYTVKYYPLSADAHMRKLSEDLFKFRTTNQTELVIHDLDLGLRYTVSVAANNAAGRGNYTDEVTVELFENCNFQLFLSGLIACQQWVHYHAETKLQSLSNSLTKDLDTRCRCGITPMFILHNPLLCDTAHPDWFIVSGRIVSTNKSRCGDIMKHLQKWAEDESKALVEGVLFAALKYCSVFLEGELPFCSNPPEPVSPTPTTEPVQRMDSSTPVTTYAIIATVVVVALALVLVLVVCIVTVTMLRKKAHNRHLRLSQRNPLSASNMQALEKHSVGAKRVDGCTGGADIYETILDYPAPPSSLSDETSMLKPPVVCFDFNPYDSTPQQSRKNTPLPHTDFNQEPPSQYITLQHIHTSTSGSKEATKGSSEYQHLMGQSEIPVYAVLRNVQKSDVVTIHKEGEDALNDDQDKYKVGGNVKESGYAALLKTTLTDEDEYASLTIKPF